MEYLTGKYYKINLKDVDQWMINIEKELLNRQWIQSSIITEDLIITMFALFKHLRIGRSMRFDDFKGYFHVIFFISLSYVGSEISYYPRHFIYFKPHNVFYDKCLKIINKHHTLMYNINSNSLYFNEYKNKLENYKEYIPILKTKSIRI